MNIVISGYTYTRQNLFEVFESYPNKDKLHFILPNNWTAKNSSVKFEPFTKEGFDIHHSPAYFAHSNYPLIGGLLKGWMPFIVFRLLWLRLRNQADILFTTGEPNLLSTLYNAFWARLFGMKHIFHFWENIAYEEKDRGLKLWLKKMIIKANLALSDGAICGMKKAEYILRSFNSDLVIGTFLHAGFDPERFKPEINHDSFASANSLEGKKVFLFVGALGYRKGIQVALKALVQVKNKQPAKLIIVGSGEYQSELKQLVGELSLEKEVVFISWIDNKKLPEIYNSADVFLYPSIPYQGWEEQFGYSIAEASLCGLPVISTNTGSIDEALIDGKTGFMVPPNDVDRLAEKMLELAVNPILAHEMGRQGRQFIKENFSNEVIAKKMFKLFSDVQSR